MVEKQEVVSYRKITVGFVVQEFEKRPDGKFHCFSQNFTAGDTVDIEDSDGEPVKVDTEKETYFCFDMVQPDMNVSQLCLPEYSELVEHGRYVCDSLNRRIFQGSDGFYYKCCWSSGSKTYIVVERGESIELHPF